jgi:hypothetical protein
MLKCLAAITTLAMAACLCGCDGSSRGTDNGGSAPVQVSAISALTCHLKTSVFAEIGPRVGMYERGSEGMEITFTDFDWRKQRALMIGNRGTAEVEARLEGPPIQIIFLERTLTGNTMMTSVFLTPATEAASTDLQGTVVKGRQASVVHSRHIMDPVSLGEANGLVSQMTGVCDIKY